MTTTATYTIEEGTRWANDGDWSKGHKKVCYRIFKNGTQAKVIKGRAVHPFSSKTKAEAWLTEIFAGGNPR